jgi:hypothetical protein
MMQQQKNSWEMSSVQSVSRLYNEEQLRLRASLETAVRLVGGWCEMAASIGVRQLEDLFQVVSCSETGDSQGGREAVDMEVEGSTALKAVTRQRLVKI